MSVHINAKKGDFAKVVLMPGDPLRAEWIANTFLHDAKKVNDVRGMYAFTGYTKNNKLISVMASGMGQPSIGIYSHELFTEYDVDIIIRIGTCGGYSVNVHPRDIVIASGACSDYNYLAELNLPGTYSPIASYDVLETAVKYARLQQSNSKFFVGNIFSSGIFYNLNSDTYKKWQRLGVLGVEMESAVLYTVAALTNKRALGIFTCSDHLALDVPSLTSEERQKSLIDMVEIAIKTAEDFIK